MDRQDAFGRLARQLDHLRLRHYGRIGRVEEELGHPKGYLRRQVGQQRLRFDKLFEALDQLGEEPGAFFSQAYGFVPSAEEQLRWHVKPGGAEPELAKVEKAARRVEADLGSTLRPSEAKLPQNRLERLLRTDLPYQRRTVRKAIWSRNPVALATYLRRLDDLRSSRAADVADLARAVVTGVLPHLGGEPGERMALLCQAIGIFASANRVTGNFETAARAVAFALSLARRHDLAIERAPLLQRGAYVLRDHGEFDHALGLLDEALVLYVEHEHHAELGKTMVDRAIVLSHQGYYARGDRSFKAALGHLAGDDPTYQRNRLAAAHGIAFTQLKMGDSTEAQKWLQRAISLAGDEDSVALAKLLWQQGRIYFNQSEFERAEEAFTDARAVLEALENPIQGAYVALDLAASLYSQNKITELQELARGMTTLLRFFEDNRLAVAALTSFIRAGVTGTVSGSLIRRVGEKFSRAYSLLQVCPM